jgi:hypothetical protein
MRALIKSISVDMNHILFIKRIQAAQAALRQSVLGMTTVVLCSVDAWSKYLH